MKKMLLLCPKFMGYDQLLINYLSNKFEINYIDIEFFLKKSRDDYKKNNIIKRIFYKLFPKVKSKYRETLLSRNDNELFKMISKYDNYDLILTINGDALSNNLYELLKEKYVNSKFVLFLWDDISLLFKKSHLVYFDKISSYNIDDCRNNNYNYQPVFTDNVQLSREKKYDISIIASATKDRIKIAKKIYEKYKNQYSFFIYFYDKKHLFNFFSYDIPLSYNDYQEKLAESRAIIECVRYKQKGPTTRVFDTIATKTKLISQNRNLIKYPIFDSNILIIGKDYNIPKDFIMTDYKESEKRKVITVEVWFENIK